MNSRHEAWRPRPTRDFGVAKLRRDFGVPRLKDFTEVALVQCFPNFFGLAPPWLPDKFPAPP